MAQAGAPSRNARRSRLAPCATRGVTALLAFGLFLPLIGFQTVTDIRNDLILDTRWPLLFAIVALVVIAARLALFACDRAVARSSARALERPRAAAWRARSRKWFMPFRHRLRRRLSGDRRLARRASAAR